MDFAWETRRWADLFSPLCFLCSDFVFHAISHLVVWHSVTFFQVTTNYVVVLQKTANPAAGKDSPSKRVISDVNLMLKLSCRLYALKVCLGLAQPWTLTCAWHFFSSRRSLLLRKAGKKRNKWWALSEKTRWLKWSCWTNKPWRVWTNIWLRRLSTTRCQESKEKNWFSNSKRCSQDFVFTSARCLAIFSRTSVDLQTNFWARQLTELWNARPRSS